LTCYHVGGIVIREPVADCGGQEREKQMAKLGTEYNLPQLDIRVLRNLDDSPHGQEMARLEEISEKLPDGEIVGGVLRFGVADGYAMYLVSNDKPLTLRHIDWLDGYRIADAHIRGLRIQDVREILRREKGMRELFSKK